MLQAVAMPQRRKENKRSSSFRDISHRDQIPEAAATPRPRRHILYFPCVFTGESDLSRENRIRIGQLFFRDID